MDRKKVIKELHDARRYLEDKEWSDRGASPHIDAINDALALLKEDCHNCKLECLLQRYDQLKEKYEKLLNEQETPNGKCVNECECWDSAYERGKQDSPKEQEAVVRCKDCKYHDEETGENFCDCGNRPDDWFCADGERREGR